MRSGWLWLLAAVAVLLLGVVGWELSTYRNLREATTNKGLPEELTSEFDPTVNESRFVIEAAYPKRQSLELRPVFPPGWDDLPFESRIACREDDIKVIYTSSGRELTGSAALFRVIEETVKENMIFAGRCRDQGCEEINRDCRLFVADR